MNLRLLLKICGVSLGTLLLAQRGCFYWTDMEGSEISIFGFLLPAFIYFSASVAAAPLTVFLLFKAGLSKTHLTGAIVALTCTVVGVWFSFIKPGHLIVFELRPAVQFLLGFEGCLLITIVSLKPILHAANYLQHVRPLLAVSIATLTPFIAGTGIYYLALDNLPHIYDGITYLVEARALASGSLYVPAMQYPELITGKEGLAFFQSDGRLFGKYPIGWPMVLSFFDAMGVRALAASTLAGGLVFWTFKIVQVLADRKSATIAAIILGATPWLWFNAATGMSHIASAFWLHMFLACFLFRHHPRGLLWSIGAGIALFMAILTRPQDAFFFALPVMAYCCWTIKTIRLPEITRLIPSGIGGIAGLVSFIAINRYLTGGDATAYGGGGGIIEQLFTQAPSSPLHWIAWIQQSIVDLNTLVFPTVPALLLAATAFWFVPQTTKVFWLPFCCATSLFLLYTMFVFGGRAWVGPRWLVPTLPSIAIMLASVIRGWLSVNESSPEKRLASQGIIVGLITVSILTSPVFVLLPKFAELRDFPPHAVSGRVRTLVEGYGLQDAVIGMPVSNGWDGEKFSYLAPRNGFVLMDAPFQNSPIVFVQMVDDWERKARADFPGRDLYELIDGNVRTVDSVSPFQDSP